MQAVGTDMLQVLRICASVEEMQRGRASALHTRTGVGLRMRKRRKEFGRLLRRRIGATLDYV